MGEKRCIQGFGGKPEKRTTWKIPGVDGRVLLRWIFRKWAWTESIWIRIGTGGGHL
jgi:hypothetical protein